MRQPERNLHKQAKQPASLRKTLFYRGQVYFQILVVFALLVGTLIVRLVFSHYHLPEYLFKILLLVGFSLTLLVIGLQAYLHHSVVSKGTFPVSWLSDELEKCFQKLHHCDALQAKNIPVLKEEVQIILEVLKESEKEHREVRNISRTLSHLIEMLHNYWQSATQNEVFVAMGRVAAEVAHDLKGPVTSVRIAAENIKTEGSNGENLEKNLHLLELSSQRLLGIANNLLSKYKGEGEKSSVFSLHAILDELLNEFGYQKPYDGVRFVKRYCSGDLYMEGSRSDLQRVIYNLLKNSAEAVQFAGTVTISTRQSEDKLGLCIEDTGCGIAQENISRIFGTYTQGKAEGNGIGLQFVKKTVELHGGSVRVESERSVGTRFFIEFPAAEDTADTETPALPFGGTIPVDNPAFKEGYTVLVIDDDPTIRAAWSLMRRKLSIANLLCYPNLEGVVAQSVDFMTLDFAFVDKNIEASRFNGADCIRFLRSKGVSKIVLASGESAEALRNDPISTQTDFILNEKIPSSLKPFLS